MKSVLVLHNPASGSAEQAVAAFEELRARHRTSVVATTSNDDARRLARAASASGSVDVVVAAGGDGTVAAVAAGLVEAEGTAALAVIPAGTANDLARTLALPEELDAAARLCTEGETRRIDLVDYEDDAGAGVMMNLASGGVAAEPTHALDETIKARWGPLAYVRGALGVLGRFEASRVTLDCDGERVAIDALLVIVANGRTSGGGVGSAPRANLEDGLLEVVVLRDGPPAEIAAVAASFVFADYLESEHVHYRRARRVELALEPPTAFSIDGEYRKATRRIDFRVRPRALRTVVGPDYVASPPED